MHPSISKQIYRLVQTLRGEDVYRYLKELEETQWYSPKRLKELQWERLRNLLNYAYLNVPYYKETFRHMGISPEEINTPNDFLKIPLLTKEKIKTNFPAFKSVTFTGPVVQYSSSGSTGEPLTLSLQYTTLSKFRAAQYRGFKWYGVNFDVRGAKIWGVPITFKERWIEEIKDLIMHRLRLSAFNLSPQSMSTFFKNCQKLRVRYLYGYASTLYRFSMFLQENRLDAQSLKLKVVVSTSEVLYDFQREAIESTFGCKVANEYGAAEVGIIAFECPKGKMHITSENVYIEFIKDNRLVSPGEMGEIVVTNLVEYNMPLIRYKLGDVGKYSDVKCSCGRGLPLLEAINGRDNDIIVAPNGTYLHSEIFSYINRALMNQGVGIKEFKIVQKDRKNLLILIVKYPNLTEKTVDFLKRQIYNFMGEEVKITVRYVDKIPQEKTGKVRYFVSEICH